MPRGVKRIPIDLSQFNLDRFIKSITGLNYIDVFASCEKSYKWAEKRLGDAITEDEKYCIREYYYPIRDFIFFMSNNAIPSTTGKDGMRLFVPVINSLIEKGQMSPEMLKMIE